jgi:hypothetical protein
MWVVPRFQPNHPFGRPIGLDCEYVYIQTNNLYNNRCVTRVRLDSLGPGLAPD